MVVDAGERRCPDSWVVAIGEGGMFRTFAGAQEFNPIALVFERFSFVERFRFWRPFRDAKHGDDSALRRIESELRERLKR